MCMLRVGDIGGGKRMIHASRMDAFMTGHATLPFELLAAIRTRVRLLAGVQAHVRLEIGFARKGFLAAFEIAAVDPDR